MIVKNKFMKIVTCKEEIEALKAILIEFVNQNYELNANDDIGGFDRSELIGNAQSFIEDLQ